MKKKEKKKPNTLDKYIILSITAVILYTIAHTLILGLTGAESAVLTICFYGFFAEEIALCCFLKKYKLQDVFKIVKGMDSSNSSDSSDSLDNSMDD